MTQIIQFIDWNYTICIIYRQEKKKLKELLIVAKEVSIMQKPKLSSSIITSQVSEYIWRIYSLQTIETKKPRQR